MTSRLTPRDIIIAILIGLGQWLQLLGALARGIWERIWRPDIFSR